jgi:hypothetical protein
MMSCRHLAITFLLLTLILAATLARAQDNYEIQVYGSDLLDPGHTMVELHSNFTMVRRQFWMGFTPPIMPSMKRPRSLTVSMTGLSVAFTALLP